MPERRSSQHYVVRASRSQGDEKPADDSGRESLVAARSEGTSERLGAGIGGHAPSPAEAGPTGYQRAAEELVPWLKNKTMCSLIHTQIKRRPVINEQTDRKLHED